MTDDFATKAGMSALSMSDNPGLVEPLYQGNDYAGSNDPLHDDEFETPADEPTSEAISVAPNDKQPSAWLRTGLTVSVCRGAGDDEYLDALVSGLASLGWEVEAAVMPATASLRGAAPRIEPAQSVTSTGRLRVALGLGLGGSLAMWQGRDARLGLVDGVVAVCPFLGFNAPIYRGNQPGALRQRAFDYATKPALRALASRIECVSAYHGLGDFVSHPLSWADVVDCASHADFAGMMSDFSCPTAIILDADDPQLDVERARSQIPAMNMMASVEIRALTGDQLLHAVDHALFSVLRYHQQGHGPASTSDASQGVPNT
jgi:hypothetical protein